MAILQLKLQLGIIVWVVIPRISLHMPYYLMASIIGMQMLTMLTPNGFLVIDLSRKLIIKMEVAQVTTWDITRLLTRLLRLMVIMVLNFLHAHWLQFRFLKLELLRQQAKCLYPGRRRNKQGIRHQI